MARHNNASCQETAVFFVDSSICLSLLRNANLLYCCIPANMAV